MIHRLSLTLFFTVLLMGGVRGASADSHPAPNISWQAHYFNNPTLTGQPTITRNESRIQHNWGNGSPANWSLVPTDHFSARWMGAFFEQRGQQYRFDVVADDGVRVYLDGRLILDRWVSTPNVPHSNLQWLPAGRHTIVVEYREAVGAANITVNIQPVHLVENHWQAEYYANPHLAGTPSLTRRDNQITRNWGNGSPANWSIVPPDNFSARWTRQVDFSGDQRVTFTVQSDDGVRIWVDNRLVLDRWTNPDVNASHVAETTIDGSPHLIRVEYREFGGRAKIAFTMEAEPLPNATVTSENAGESTPDFPSASPQIDTASFRFHYEFDNPNDPMIDGSPTAVNSPVGQALEFKDDDFVKLNYSEETFGIGTGDFSVAFWMRTDSTETTVSLFDMRSITFFATHNCGAGRGEAGPDDCGTRHGYHVYLIDGALGLQLAVGDGSQFRCGSRDATCTNYTSDVRVNDGEWHTVAITVDRDQKDGLRFYVDGVLRDVMDPTDRPNSLSLFTAEPDPDCSNHPYSCWITYYDTSLAHGVVAMDTFRLFEGIISAETIAREHNRASE